MLLGIAGVCRIAGVNARKGIMEWECAYLSHHLEFLLSVIVLGNVDVTLSLACTGILRLCCILTLDSFSLF